MRVFPVFPSHGDGVLLSKVYLFWFAVPLCTVLLCAIFYYADYLIHKVNFLFCLPIHEEIVKFQLRRVAEQHWHHFKNSFHKVVVVLLSQFKLTLADHIRYCLVVQQKCKVDQRQVCLRVALQQPKPVIKANLLLCADVWSKTHFCHLGLQLRDLLLQYRRSVFTTFRIGFKWSLLDDRG